MDNTDRRKFIKNSGVLAGALLMAPAIGKAMVTDSNPALINIGIIGCGQRGQGIMEILKDLQGQFAVKAISDVLDFRFTESGKFLDLKDVKTYQNYRGLLESNDVDAVIIAVPLYLHASVAKDALASGKHIYLEKTMAYSIPQVLELVELVKKYPKQIFQVGHQYRYSPLYYKVKEMIEKGYLGKVTAIDCRWDRNGSWRRPLPQPDLEKQINWRMYKAYSGGLPAELLSHQIDFVNWAFNTHPDQIYASGGIDYWKDGRETYDNVQAILRYEKSGMIGTFGATCSNAYDGYLFKLRGTKGTVSLLVDKGVYFPEKEQIKTLQTIDGVTGATKLEWNKEGGINIDAGPLKDGTWYALMDFYNSVKSGKVPDSNVITGATTALCVHLINKSAEASQPQFWKPEYNLSYL